MLMHLVSATATATASVFCAATLTLQPAPAQAEASILAAVPADSYVLAYCADFDGLRSRVERNDWYRLLASETGTPLLLDIASEFDSETGTDLLELLKVGKHLHGESVFYLTQSAAGFVTVPPTNRGGLAEAMHEWLPDPGPQAVAKQVELGGAQIEFVAWRDSEAYGWNARKGHYAAFVDHPRLMGLFSADDAGALLATIEASLASIEAETRSPLVQQFEAARAGKPSCYGIETFVNLSPFVEEAEQELTDMLDGVVPDPTGMLGIDGGIWLLAASDVYPGSRIDCSAWMNIPTGTLAASLADTFEPLPVELPAQLPRDLANLWACRWDLKVFYKSVREALQNKHGEGGLEQLDQTLEMAKAMGGIDPIDEVINQLDGTFALFTMRTSANRAGRDPFNYHGLGFLASLENGGAFLAAFERLVSDDGPLESILDLTTIEGTDVYVTGVEDDGFGVAFLPQAVLFGLRETMPRSLRALTGIPDSNLLDGSEFRAALDQNQGCCALAIHDLAGMEAVANERMDGSFTLPPEEGEETGRNPFDALVVFSVRRTPEGFRFELHTQ